MMKIEAGKYYRTRTGGKVGPLVRTGLGGNSEWTDRGISWGDDGRHCNDDHCGLDIVAEWPPEPTGPVVVETVKRIVPGTYGIIRVHFDGSFSIVSTRIPAEIRAAAATLTEIADALDEGDSPQFLEMPERDQSELLEFYAIADAEVTGVVAA